MDLEFCITESSYAVNMIVELVIWDACFGLQASEYVILNVLLLNFWVLKLDRSHEKCQYLCTFMIIVYLHLFVV
jgi:hypothetical protein